MVCWEIMLSKGQEWDWLGDPFFRVQTLLAGFALGLGGLIYRELRLRNPLVALRTLTDRNFRACCIIIFCAYGVLYANTVSLPELLQSLFGYNATISGLVLSPAGIFAIMMLLIVGALLGRGVDARFLMAAGLITMSLGNFWMAHLNLEIGPWQVVWPRVVIIVGTVDAVRSAQRGGLHLSAEGDARRRGRIARPAAQRRRQRGDLGRPDHPGTARCSFTPCGSMRASIR